MKLEKQIFLPILLSLSVFFSSTVMLSSSAYAAVTPQASFAHDAAATNVARQMISEKNADALQLSSMNDAANNASRQTASVRMLAEAAPNNTEVPKVDAGKSGGSEKSGSAGSKSDSSFFEEVFEKIAVMFLLYMFLEAIQAILHDFFNDGETKIKITPKEKQNTPDNKGTNQNKNTKRIPAQDM